MNILVVEFPKAPAPQRMEDLPGHWSGSPHGITRRCKKCGNTMWCDQYAEVKTMAPPLYVFRCMCGRAAYAHLQSFVDGGMA